jgi:hypothetical protein
MKSCAVVLFIALSVGAGASSAQTRGVQGVWRGVEVTLTGANARTLRNLQPRLLIFMQRHYSRIDVTSEQPRVAPADFATATADELRAVWSPFTANAGTYEVAAGMLTILPTVAKNPGVMAPGVFSEFSYRIQGDTLWLTSRRDQTGSIADPTSYRYVRIE